MVETGVTKTGNKNWSGSFRAENSLKKKLVKLNPTHTTIGNKETLRVGNSLPQGRECQLYTTKMANLEKMHTSTDRAVCIYAFRNVYVHRNV